MQPPPGERPPTLPRWAKWIAAPIMWAFGWKYGGGLPNIPKMVIIGVPHTTNWDGFWYLVITAYMRLRTNVIMKAEIARTPFVGWVFKKFGGIPVERSTSNNLVTQWPPRSPSARPSQSLSRPKAHGSAPSTGTQGSIGSPIAPTSPSSSRQSTIRSNRWTSSQPFKPPATSTLTSV
ncbi:MAG: hypothetical protein HND48_14630 [Chloroflexi bacterium]|nr:hypothetical protein [Chloroflexota bacterium]